MPDNQWEVKAMWEKYQVKEEQIKAPDFLKQQVVEKMNAYQVAPSPQVTSLRPPQSRSRRSRVAIAASLAFFAFTSVSALAFWGITTILNQNNETMPVYSECDYHYDDDCEGDDYEAIDDDCFDEDDYVEVICVDEGGRNIIIIPPEE